MTKYDEALEVLLRAQEQLVKEIATCGHAGGVGRAQNYAPVLVNVSDALAIVRKLHMDSLPVQTNPPQVQDHMAKMREAKQSKALNA